VRAPTHACFADSSHVGSFSAHDNTSRSNTRSAAEHAPAADVHVPWSPKRLPEGMPVHVPRRADWSTSAFFWQSCAALRPEGPQAASVERARSPGRERGGVVMSFLKDG
jgi:hypothetical protein